MKSLLKFDAGRPFAVAQMVLCLLASGGYILSGEPKKALYWLAAATITGCVTF